MTPLIVAVAPNGARLSKADHPALPLSPAEIATTAAACLEAGACMIHLHVRNPAGGHTLDVETYNAATEAIRDAVGDKMIIQISSEAVGLYKPEQQMAAIRTLKPEAVSLALREIVPDKNHEVKAARFLTWLKREGVFIQYILYSASELSRFHDLWHRGVIPHDDPSLLFVLGAYGATFAQPDDLAPFMTEETKSMHWMLCAFGPHEGACLAAAMEQGGHARVGFENNTQLSNGSQAPDNAALVQQTCDCAALFQRPLADADAARKTYHCK